MEMLGPNSIKYRDVVVVESRVMRFRWDPKTGKALYKGPWEHWRTKFDILKISRLCEGVNPVEPEPSDNEADFSL